MKLYNLEINNREGILIFIALISLLGMLMTYYAANEDVNSCRTLLVECRIENGVMTDPNLIRWEELNVINSTKPS